MSAAVFGQSLDGYDRCVLELDGKRETGENGLAVDEDGAGPALAELAAVLGSREPQVLSQHFEERFVRGNRDLPGFPVHPEPQQDVLAHIRYSTIGPETPAMVR